MIYYLSGLFFGGEFDVLRTITIGSCVSVQGTFVRALPGGMIAVKVDDTVYAGRPIKTVH